MILISVRDSAHDFSMKFSPSVCATVVASLTGEMAEQSFFYVHAQYKPSSPHPTVCRYET